MKLKLNRNLAFWLLFLVTVVDAQKAKICDLSCSDLLAVTEKSDRETFLEVARNCPPVVTDKITDHDYESMYGDLLIPYLRDSNLKKKGGVKFLEIGLGCDMVYGPGSSSSIWKQFLSCPGDELWMGEFNKTCVDDSRRKGQLDGIKTVVGDQGDPATLKQWLEVTGGIRSNFDIIIDDGGHQQHQIFESLLALWPALKPGGLYFIEDLQVSRWAFYNTRSAENYEPIIDHIKQWIENKLEGNPEYLQNWHSKTRQHHHSMPAAKSRKISRPILSSENMTSMLHRQSEYSMPTSVAHIDVYHESVVLRKCAIGEKGCDNPRLPQHPQMVMQPPH